MTQRDAWPGSTSFAHILPSLDAVVWSLVRRPPSHIKAIKNVCISSPPALLSTDPSLLLALLEPLIGPEDDYPPDEMEELPPALQFLGPEKRREADAGVRGMLVECLLALASRGGREGREVMRGFCLLRLMG